MSRTQAIPPFEGGQGGCQIATKSFNMLNFPLNF